MSDPRLHIVFSVTAAADLRKALKLVGRSDEVVALSDDYRYGPIEPLDPALREAWIADELGFEMEGFLPLRHEEFWSAALSDRLRRVVWTSRRSALEHLGFLAWTCRIADAAIDIVDLTNVETTKPSFWNEAPPYYAVLPMMQAEEILSAGLIDQARSVTLIERTAAREEWARLAAENAPLRVLRNGRVVSVPITHFDDVLLENASHEWRKMARVVGGALTSFEGENALASGDLLLFGRLRSLIEAGKLESVGDPYDLPRCEVRLPSKRSQKG